MLPIPAAITGKTTKRKTGKSTDLVTQLLKFAPKLITKANALPLKLRLSIINKIPRIIKPAFTLLPFNAQKALLLPALTSVFKEALADGDFEFLQNKWLRINITDLNIHWWLSVENGQLIMAPGLPAKKAATPAITPEKMGTTNPKAKSETKNETDNQLKEDVSFSASGDDLLLIAGRKQDPDTLFFQRRLKIEGDTELGLELKNLIDAIDIEHLPGLVHEVVAASAELLQQTQSEQAELAAL